MTRLLRQALKRGALTIWDRLVTIGGLGTWGDGDCLPDLSNELGAARAWVRSGNDRIDRARALRAGDVFGPEGQAPGPFDVERIGPVVARIGRHEIPGPIDPARTLVAQDEGPLLVRVAPPELELFKDSVEYGLRGRTRNGCEPPKGTSRSCWRDPRRRCPPGST